jgi:hypothetical protein
MPSDPSSPLPLPLPRTHARRLREIWRSAGWPCHDLIEIDLLTAGMLERVRHASGHETLRVTDAGVRVLAQALQRNRHALSAHEALVERVAREMGRAGRLVWRNLAVRAPLAAPEGRTIWAVAMPDVYSIRHTTVEDYVEPIVHEVKVSRADLLGDLRRTTKRAAYLALSSECWYVIRDGIARADEVPPECGVLVAAPDGFEVARPAPKRAMRLPFALWMALARATPAVGHDSEDAQGWLGAEDERAPLDMDAAQTACDADAAQRRVNREA